MNCIKEYLIQKYIDCEASTEEATQIENHISNCNKCFSRIEDRRILAYHVKNAIIQIQEDTIEIPRFEIPSRSLKKHILSGKRLYYIIAAASILLFIIFIAQKKEHFKDDEMIFETGSALYVDANRTPSDFPLVINIIDAKGNISEHLIK